MKRRAKIIGLGSYLPERVLSNGDLEKMVDTSDEWITKRTGIKERRIAAADEASSDMGCRAAREAIAKSSTPKEAIDYIIVATMSPDHLAPSTAALIQGSLGLSHIPALDIQAACSGFLYGLSLAKAYVESGAYRNILVIATEKMSSVVDYEERSTCILFGDGASAAVVSSNGAGLLIDRVTLGADGKQAALIAIPSGGSRSPASKENIDKKLHYVKLEGKEVFKHAVRRMAEAGLRCLEEEKLSIADLKWVVPHQANLRIIEALVKQLSIPEEIVVKTIHKYGNTSASSIPLALDDLLSAHRLESNDKMLLVAFGAGLTWGACLLRQTEERE